MKIDVIRGLKISLIVFLLIAIMSSCTDRSKSDQNSVESKSGITITGGEEGQDWTFENPKILQITGNNITISGTAEKDLKIECLDVSKLKIQSLKQNKHQIRILAYEDCTLDFIGRNEVLGVYGLKSMTIRGCDNDAQLLLYDHASGSNLDIHNARICAESFKADRDINITGKSIVIVKEMSNSSTESLVSRVWAHSNININMDPGGSLEVKDAKDIMPLSAEGRIILGKNNKIMIPQNGEIINDEDSLEGSVIYDAEGEDAEDVIIRNISEQ